MAESRDICTILSAEITRKGVIPFSQFMETALYCPEIGYYERSEARIGRGGDFFTSVSVGSFFGELLAIRFAEWLAAYGDVPVQIVEAGAHDGQLALDILEALNRCGKKLSERVEYWIVEPSTERQKRQEGKLDKFAGQVRWWRDLEKLPPVVGVIFSNELLDAMPVRRYGWNAAKQEWFEWGVALRGSGFVWDRMEADADLVRRRLAESALPITPELEAVLPADYTVEWSEAAGIWWHAAARKLKAGKLLTFDYGLSADEFIAPERTDGTLRGYSRHGVADPLANAGNQDITAHVNFTQLQLEGERAGLKTVEYEAQGAFLSRIIRERGTITAEQGRQFQTLAHPEHLGGRFRVLVQER